MAYVLRLLIARGCLLPFLAACGVDPLPPVVIDAPPNWEQIKRSTRPYVALPSEYGMPYRQPQSTLAWEDGIFISRDGLHMYAFYAPADLWQYSRYAAEHPDCPDITPFLRGPRLGMDLTTNPWGCPTVMHSDIAYAARNSTTEPFGPWQRTALAFPARYEGGVHALDNSDGTIDLVFSMSTEERANDLFWIRGIRHPPPPRDPIPLPPPINTDGQEDNPHLERLDDGTLVLLFDNHGLGDARTTIKYALSHDDGKTWTTPRELGDTINAGPHDMTGHLYHDGHDWWLYFASERSGALSIYRSRHVDPARMSSDFDQWDQPELVIGPGDVLDDSGVVAGVGEPTLTSSGDISFAVVYVALTQATPYDRVDIDPWFLPKRSTSMQPMPVDR